SKPQKCAANGDDCGVVPKRLLVAGGESSRLLEQIEGALDFGAGHVELLVVRSLLRTASVRWDHGHAAAFLKRAAEVVRIVGLVGEQASRRDSTDEFLRRHDVVALPFRDLEREREAECVDDQLDL